MLERSGGPRHVSLRSLQSGHRLEVRVMSASTVCGSRAKKLGSFAPLVVLHLLVALLFVGCRAAPDRQGGARSALAAPTGSPVGLSSPQESETTPAKKPASAEGRDDDGRTGDAQKTPSREELERRFSELMSNAVLDGQWRLVSDDGKLGDEHVEKYTLGAVRKVEGDAWRIEARIQYGSKDVGVIPVPVEVRWAGDTPVICVTKLWIPGLGSYTARVTVYDGFYAGIWSAPDHGGLMSGVVRPAPGSGEGESAKPVEPKEGEGGR